MSKHTFNFATQRDGNIVKIDILIPANQIVMFARNTDHYKVYTEIVNKISSVFGVASQKDVSLQYDKNANLSASTEQRYYDVPEAFRATGEFGDILEQGTIDID